MMPALMSEIVRAGTAMIGKTSITVRIVPMQ